MFSCIVKPFLNLLWQQVFPHSEHLLFSSATLLCKAQNILTLTMIVYYNTNFFFLRSFSLMRCTTDTAVGLFQLINNQGLK